MSGVACNDDCVAKFDQMKIRHTHRFIVYKIKDDKSAIEIETEGSAELTYDDFLAAMPEDAPRYAVVDIPYTLPDGRPQEKICFFLWNPDTCGVKAKMLYASSKDSIRKKLQGVHKEIQANDRSDMELAEIVSELTK
jgi:cofilin